MSPTIPRPERNRTIIPDSPPRVRKDRHGPEYRMAFATGGHRYFGRTGHTDLEAARNHAETVHALVVAAQAWRSLRASAG